MTFLQSGQVAANQNFRLRVQACLFKLAQDVINESDEAADHQVREVLAHRVIADPGLLVDRFAWLCAANPAVSATVSPDGTEVGSPDGDIEFVCASNWTPVSTWWVAFTGVTVAPTPI